MQPADAADAMQDTMISVSNDLDRYDPQIASGKFRGWLWIITRRRIADLRRRQDTVGLLGSAVGSLIQRTSAESMSSKPSHDLADDPPTDEASDEVGLLHRAVLTYRHRYDATTWKAFWMTVVEGRQVTDVAADLGLSRWAVYKARSRILQRLRQDLDAMI